MLFESNYPKNYDKILIVLIIVNILFSELHKLSINTAYLILIYRFGTALGFTQFSYRYTTCRV